MPACMGLTVDYEPVIFCECFEILIGCMGEASIIMTFEYIEYWQTLALKPKLFLRCSMCHYMPIQFNFKLIPTFNATNSVRPGIRPKGWPAMVSAQALVGRGRHRQSLWRLAVIAVGCESSLNFTPLKPLIRHLFEARYIFFDRPTCTRRGT